MKFRLAGIAPQDLGKDRFELFVDLDHGQVSFGWRGIGQDSYAVRLLVA